MICSTYAEPIQDLMHLSIQRDARGMEKDPCVACEGGHHSDRREAWPFPCEVPLKLSKVLLMSLGVA